MNLHASNSACQTVSPQGIDEPPVRVPAPVIPIDHTDGLAPVDTGVYPGAAARAGVESWPTRQRVRS